MIAGKSELLQTIATIEDVLIDIYGDRAGVSAGDFLMSQEYFEHMNPQKTGLRAGLYLAEEAGELLLGIHFAPDLMEKIQQTPPVDRLTHLNLDAFCVVVEEVSHLRLLSDRAHCGLNVSQIELEWQAEVDKVWVASQLLNRQCGDPHFGPLTRAIFDTSTTTDADDAPRYDEASRLAAVLWYSLLATADSDRQLASGTALRGLFRRLYNLNWAEKASFLDGKANLKSALAA